MPIGAIAGAAVVGAGASIYTGSKAAKAQKKAAQSASDTSLQTATMNNQLARDMYASNAARLDPYSRMGLAAGDGYMGILLGQAPAASATSPNGWVPGTPAAGGTGTGAGAGTGATAGYHGPTFAQIAAMNHDGTPGNMHSAMADYLAYYQAHPSENPGITTSLIGQINHDHIAGDEDAARALMEGYANYQALHPATPAVPAATPATPATPPATTSALAPFAGSGPIQQQAQAAIAAGADPAAVRARAASMGVHF